MKVFIEISGYVLDMIKANSSDAGSVNKLMIKANSSDAGSVDMFWRKWHGYEDGQKDIGGFDGALCGGGSDRMA